MLRPSCRIYSVGYEGTTAEELADRLARHGVSLLVDVRLQPWSRRPGFSKQPLSVALAMAGIEYVHEPLFGNPPENREAYRQGDPAAVQVMRDGWRSARASWRSTSSSGRPATATWPCCASSGSRAAATGRSITDMAKDKVLGPRGGRPRPVPRSPAPDA